MDLQSAKAELKRPPELQFKPILIETAVVLSAAAFIFFIAG